MSVLQKVKDIWKKFTNSSIKMSSKFSFINSQQVQFGSLSIENLYSYYLSNPIVYRGINMISKAVSDIEITNEPINNWKNFCNEMMIYLLVTGNCFITSNFELLNPQDVSFEDNLYKIKDKAYENVLHIKLFNPIYPSIGLSPLHCSHKAIETSNLINDFLYSIIKNQGRPSGILSLKGSAVLSEPDKEQIVDNMRSMYNNIGSSGDVAIIAGETDWTSIGLNPKDLDLPWINEKISQEIAISLGLPISLLGQNNDIYNNNYRTAIKQFHFGTVMAYHKRILQDINFHFKLNIEAKYDLAEDQM